jgi:hypothetical protein
MLPDSSRELRLQRPKLPRASGAVRRCTIQSLSSRARFGEATEVMQQTNSSLRP